MTPVALYAHVPFCAQRCRYCDFVSTRYDAYKAATYLAALAEDVDCHASEAEIRTVYVGGGTPTALSTVHLTALLDILSKLDLSGVVEYTVEANPGTIDVEKLQSLRQAGVNRLSIGVQSFHDEALRVLGRSHTAKQARAAVGIAREAGIENISLDLIYGWPGQTPQSWQADLEEAVRLEPEHISCYGLTYPEGTSLWRARERGEILPQSEDEERELFDMMGALLAAPAWERYEISNFCRKGRECRHNRVYWEGGPYIGVGPGACSYVDGVRSGNVPDVEQYIRRTEEGTDVRTWQESLPPERAARERLVIGLRLLKGIEADRFAAETGFSIESLLGDGLTHLIREGWLEWRGRSLALTSRALPVADTVLAELVA
jgi:oxygen-independent coproporphyrinogen-3 oxidase